MNQILMVEEKKKKTPKSKTSSEPIEIKHIVRFFAIILIIFGIAFIGQGSYAIYKDIKGKNAENIPNVSIERFNDTIIVKVNSTNKITNLKYSWENAEETVIPVDDNYAEESITLPNENSTIHLTIEDETDRAVKYSKYLKIEGIDMTKPMINIEEETKGSVKVSATDETEMSYITYQINDGEEVRVDKSEVEHNTINYILQFERGKNEVVITAVDKSGNIETLEKTIVVSEVPDITVSQDKNVLKINIKDTDGIKKVEINLNGVAYAQDNINQKELYLQIPLAEGNNIIKIKVTNVNSLVTETVGEMTYEP